MTRGCFQILIAFQGFQRVLVLSEGVWKLCPDLHTGGISASMPPCSPGACGFQSARRAESVMKPCARFFIPCDRPSTVVSCRRARVAEPGEAPAIADPEEGGGRRPARAEGHRLRFESHVPLER